MRRARKLYRARPTYGLRGCPQDPWQALIQGWGIRATRRAEESPVQVGGIAISADENFSFSASGLVSQGNGTPAFGPDGNTGGITSLDDGAVNGLASITAPFDALVGVFLDGSQPSSFSPPGALDFSTQSERDFQSLSPALRQTFYIGDGLTSASIVQHFLAPAGATRLFLGTMDSYQWANNTGMYTVTVAGFPTILGDANLDGKVDLNDLNVVLNHLGLTDSLCADGNFDSAATIDLNDLNDVLNNLGTGTGTGAASVACRNPCRLAYLWLAGLGFWRGDVGAWVAERNCVALRRRYTLGGSWHSAFIQLLPQFLSPWPWRLRLRAWCWPPPRLLHSPA